MEKPKGIGYKTFKIYLLATIIVLLSSPLHPAQAVTVHGCDKNDPNQYIETELGRICTQPDALVKDILEILLYVAGGVTLLLLLIGSGLYMTSSGNPEKTEEAKKILTAAISGSLLIFFSIFLLRLVGIDILGLPGLSKPGGGGVLEVGP